MSEHQQRDDHSSTCSDFEPIFGVPQTEEQLDVEVEPNVYNKEDDEQQTGNENDDEGGRSSATGDLNSSQQSVQQHIAAAEGNNMNLMTMLHLQLKLANAEKEKAELKAEMVGKMQANMQKEVEQSEADKAASEEHGRMMEKKVSELSFGLTELRDQLHNLKATVLEDTKQQISLKLKNATTPVHIALRSFKVDMEQRLELLEKGSSVECLRNLLEEDRLKEWLVTGAGQLRNVTLLRDISQQLVTSSYWNIQPGGLKANKTGSIWTSVRAIHPHSVANASPDGKPLFYFEVSVTGATDDSYVYIGLCDCNFDFTSQSTYVGNVAGSFAMRKDGTFLASGTEQSGFGKGAFANGDVVGCGLLVLPAERRLFYTKNGEIWVKPILLGPEDAKDNLRPIVSAYDSSTQVEFNFGADFAAKPFKYELTQLNVADG